MQLRPPVVERDVAEQRKHLDLLVDRDALIVLLLPVEVAEHAIPKCAERRELAGRQPVLPGERRQASSPVSRITANVRCAPSLISLPFMLPLRVRGGSDDRARANGVGPPVASVTRLLGAGSARPR
jgi:hypothetical protein